MPAVLYLNPIFASSEIKQPIAYAESIDDLKKFVESERVDTYSEEMIHPSIPDRSHTFYKFFKKGGPLENFNTPDDSSYIDIPTREQVMEQEGIIYDRFISKLIKI